MECLQLWWAGGKSLPGAACLQTEHAFAWPLRRALCTWPPPTLVGSLSMPQVLANTQNAHAPAAHTFPREAYDIMLYINRAYLSSLMALLYPLQSGRLALRRV